MKRLLGSFGILSALVGLLVLTGSTPARAEDGVTDKEVVLTAFWYPVIGRAVPAPGDPGIAVAVIPGRRASRMTR